MAELKRTFSGGKMNTDLDDRVLQPGDYRDALNVGVGSSEGSNVGALENIRGNMVLPGQNAIGGTTIGTVRDPNNDRIYWFNTGEVNAVYEFDEATGLINTIISDKASRVAPEPTCAPDTRATITLPDGNGPSRPLLPTLPDPPRGYCSAGGATNTNMRADGTAANTSRDFIDNGICTFPPSFNCSGAPSFTCSDPGNGSGSFSSLSDCNAGCNAPPPPGGGGVARSLVVSGCPSGPQTVGGTVTLTVTAGGFTGVSTTSPITVMVTGYSGPPILITSGSGSATFDVTSAAVGTVTYTPSGTAAGQSSVRNTPCVIGWGASPPTITYSCTAFLNPITGNNCFPDLTGASPHASPEACAAACTTVAPRDETCRTATITNPGVALLFTYVRCGIPTGSVCSATTINIGARFQPVTEVCIVTNQDVFCDGFGGVQIPPPGYTLTANTGSTNVQGATVSIGAPCS